MKQPAAVRSIVNPSSKRYAIVMYLDSVGTDVCSTGGKLPLVWCLVKMKQMIN